MLGCGFEVFLQKCSYLVFANHVAAHEGPTIPGRGGDGAVVYGAALLFSREKEVKLI